MSNFGPAGRLTSITDRNGQAATFRYLSGLLRTVTSTRGGSGAKTASDTFSYGVVTSLTRTGDSGTTGR